MRPDGLEGNGKMSQGDSVTRLLIGIKTGDDRDIERLWDRYFERLVRLAGARLPRGSRRAFDEEDVALSAFRSFCDRAGRGQFPRLADRDDLWRLLATITTRKLIDAIRHQSRQKRGGGQVLGESALLDNDGPGGPGLARFLGREPTPEAANQMADEYERLLERLGDPVLQAIAVRRLDGETTEEVAVALGLSTRSVDRKLGLIRAIWREEAPR